MQKNKITAESKKKHGRIVLAGNPNVGKSVIFGLLTGQYATVSNYPGTTVEVSSGNIELGCEDATRSLIGIQSREVGRLGIARHRSAAAEIYRDSIASVLSASTEEGAVNQTAARTGELAHKCINVTVRK